LVTCRSCDGWTHTIARSRTDPADQCTTLPLAHSHSHTHVLLPLNCAACQIPRLSWRRKAAPTKDRPGHLAVGYTDCMSSTNAIPAAPHQAAQSSRVNSDQDADRTLLTGVAATTPTKTTSRAVPAKQARAPTRAPVHGQHGRTLAQQSVWRGQLSYKRNDSRPRWQEWHEEHSA
jgi:hypothetical protein